jgi:cytochrome c-type biogenesis protein CcmH
MRRAPLAAATLLTLGALLLCPPLGAVEVREFRDPAEEARYQHLIAELRCLVCQNQSLADSNADLARDLRTEVYQLIRQGRGEEEAVAFLVARYGDFVRYRPPVNATTWLLWTAPALAAFLALLVAWRVIRRHRPTSAPPPLAPAQIARLAEPPHNPPFALPPFALSLSKGGSPSPPLAPAQIALPPFALSLSKGGSPSPPVPDP